MKEIEVERIVNDCTAQLYFDAIYATDVAMRTFHAKVNDDPAAVVGSWTPDGLRTVQFVMPMNVPAMLKKFIGLDSVPVVETQKLEWLVPGKAFKLVSEPQLNFPGANKFSTSGHLEVRSLPNGTCQVKALVRCSAAMPWPVQATVEGLMATEAVESIGTFLTFCQQFFAAWRSEQLEQPEAPAPAPSATVAGDGGGGGGGGVGLEQFYDAVEDESELLRGGGPGEGEEGETSVVPYQPPRLEDIIVDCLRQIQASSAETARTLKTLEELIRNMDDNMQVVRDKLVGRRQPPRATSSAPAQGQGTAAPAARTSTSGAGAGAGATTPASSYTPSKGGTATSIPVGALATVSLVCGTGAFLYLRYRLGAGGGGGGGGK